MATYRGVPYEAGVGPTDKDVVLFAACPPPEELGFQPAPGHWRKSVRRAEVDAVWESRPSGTFRGEPCLVLDDLGERLHISYLGHDPARAARLGYSQMEPGVFELLAGREEVTEITEDRVDHPFLPWHEPAAESRPWHEPAAEGGAALAHRGPDPGPGADARHTEPFPSVDARHGEPWAGAWPGADARDTHARSTCRRIGHQLDTNLQRRSCADCRAVVRRITGNQLRAARCVPAPQCDRRRSRGVRFHHGGDGVRHAQFAAVHVQRRW